MLLLYLCLYAKLLYTHTHKKKSSQVSSAWSSTAIANDFDQCEHYWTKEWAWHELPTWLSSEQASKFGVCTQLNLHHSAISTLFLQAVYCCLFPLTEFPCSAVLVWLKKIWALAFHKGLSTATVRELSSLAPRPMNNLCTGLKTIRYIAISTQAYSCYCSLSLIRC